MMRAVLVLLVMLLAVPGTLCATEQPAADGRPVPIDPQIVLADIENAYRNGTGGERIDLRVSAGGQSRDEVAMIWFAPGRLRVDLGEYSAIADETMLRIVHVGNKKAYTQLALGPGGIAEALAQSMPPIPLPLSIMGWSPPEARVDASPYARDVRWKEAIIHPDRMPRIALLRGTITRGTIDIEADVDSGRILRTQTVIDGIVKIESTSSAIEAPNERIWALDLQGRILVDSTPELAVVGMELGAGDAFPEIYLVPRQGRENVTQVVGPAIVIFFPDWQRGTTPIEAVRAAELVAGQLPGITVWSTLVMHPGEALYQSKIEGAAAEIAPAQLWFTMTPKMTMEKFSRSGRPVVVVVNGQQKIVLVEEVEPQRPKTPPDPDAIAAFAARIHSALQP